MDKTSCPDSVHLRSTSPEEIMKTNPERRPKKTCNKMIADNKNSLPNSVDATDCLFLRYR